MPAVVAGALVSAVGLTGVVATVATAALGAVASMAVQSMVARPKNTNASSASGRRIDLVRSATEPRRIVYGEARVSGPLVFANTTNSPSGQKNYVLSLVVPVAAHEVDKIGAIYVNDERFVGLAGADGWTVPPVGSRYNAGANRNGVNAVHFVQWRSHMGAEAQTVDTFLTATNPIWTVRHRLRGVAYVALRLNWDSTVWAGGLPNLSWEVRGRKVYDPRTGTTAWSSNPALCIRDYLVSSFGMNCTADEIDEASFIAAANLCDELVPIASGGEQERYSCNGVFSLDEKPIDVMERLLSSCAGTLVYSQGRYRLYPAAYRQPVLELDAGILRGAAVVRPKASRRQTANTVRGTYIDPVRGWQASDFPPVKTDLSEEGGEVLPHDLELPFTTNVYAAQRLAGVQLLRSRNALTVELPCTLAALDVAVMEPVRLTLPQLGWTDKVFTPIEWTMTPEGGIDLVVQEDDPSFYAWSGGVVPTDDTPDVDLPDIYPAAPLLMLSDTVEGLVVSVMAADDGFIARTEVEFRRSGEEAWQHAGNGTQVLIAGVTAGVVYDVRGRSVTVLGLTSPWSSVSRQVTGGSTPPSDVSALTASLIDGTLYLDWLRPNGAVEHYRLRWSPLTSGASWAGATDLSAMLTNTRISVPARLGTYLLKAVDALGRESVGAASYVNITPETRSTTVVATQTEHPSFAGSKSNCVVNGSSQLIIESLSAFDAQSGSFDVAAGSFDSAGGGTSPGGVYTFANVIDLGAVYGVRASALVKASVIDLVTDVDAVAGDFDEREGWFDGDAPSAVDVVIELSTTPDNPVGSPVWGAWQRLSVGDYTGRAFRFRAVLSSNNPMATPAVEQLSVTLDMADRVEAAASVVSSASGSVVTFAEGFKATPAIAVTGSNLQSGDYATITAQSRTGFTVQFKNAAGTGVTRSFDWVARGYGREIV